MSSMAADVSSKPKTIPTGRQSPTGLTARSRVHATSVAFVDDPLNATEVTCTVFTLEAAHFYGTTTVPLRLGTSPTGMRATSLRDAMSMAETELAPEFA